MENRPDRLDERHRPSRLLVAITIGWALLFSYLLLTSDPPDIGPVRLRSFEDPGHFFGSALLGILLFLVVVRRRTPRRAAAIALLVSLGFLTALEVFQLVRPGRGYQALDLQLNAAGAAAGVAVAWVLDRMLRSRRIRAG